MQVHACKHRFRHEVDYDDDDDDARGGAIITLLHGISAFLTFPGVWSDREVIIIGRSTHCGNKRRPISSTNIRQCS